MAVATLPTHEVSPSASVALLPTVGLRPDDEAFVAAATEVARSFAPDLLAALEAFAHDPGPAGACCCATRQRDRSPRRPPPQPARR